MIRKLFFFFLIVIFFGFSLEYSYPQEKKPLSIEDIKDLIGSFVSIKRIINLIADYGISFEKNEENIDKLKKIGWDESILEAIEKEWGKNNRFLVIETDPVGATVYLDGVKRGQTPLRLERLKPKEYTIRIQKEGYLDTEQKVSLIESIGKTIEAKLNKKEHVVVHLNYSIFFHASHKHALLATEWTKEIEKRTNGAVKIKIFSGGSLTPADKCYDGVVKGTSDIGMSVLGYTRGRFPLTEVIDLPLGYKSGLAATKLINEYFKRFKPKEFEDVIAMYFHAHGPTILHTKKPVNSLKDLKGMRIRSSGIAAKIVSSLGATPVAMPMGETYDALRRGVVDGIMTIQETLVAWKLGEIVRYTVESYGPANSLGFFVVMNKDRWNALPPDIQKIIEDVNEEWIEKTGRLWDELDKEGRDYAQRTAHQIISLSNEENERWAKAVRPILDEYVNNMRAKGLPGDEALKFCLNHLKQIPLAVAPLHASEFPTKEVQVIIPWAPGGVTDLIFRALAATTGKYLGKAVVVVNRSGGGSAVGYTEAMKAQPDGYTLASAVTPLTILPHQVTTAYNYKNFEPIINVVSDLSMFLVRSDAPWKSLKEFLDYVKKHPGMITVGNSGAGGGGHLVALAFEKAVGVTFNHIPFPGTGPSVTAILGGHINAVSVSPPEVIQLVKAGKLKIIAIFAEKRFELFPDVPTVKEQGIDFVMGMWRGLAAPKGTPPDVIKKLHDAFKQGMDDPVFRKNVKDMAMNLHYLNGEAFEKLMATDHEFYSKLVKEIKAKEEEVKRALAEKELEAERQRVAKLEAEGAERERRLKEAIEAIKKEVTRTIQEEATKMAQAEKEKKEFERSLVVKKMPGIEGEVIETRLLKDIHFDFGKYDIRPEDAKILRENAALMKYPNVKIMIEGHCDERKNSEYALALGYRRANSTKKFLISLGISPDRISTISYGKERPLDPGHNEEAWAKNRRAHTIILSKLVETPVTIEPNRPSIDAGTFYRDAFETLQKGDLEGARLKFEAFLKQYPDTELSDNAQFWIGETYYLKRDFEKAILEYEKVITKYPEGDKIPAAMFKQALAFLEVGDRAIARNLLRRLVERYPDSDSAVIAKKRLEILR